MDIHTVAKYAQLGYRIRRSYWAPGVCAYEEHELLWLKSASETLDCPLTIDDLLADDWEIITEGIIKDFPITYSD